MCTTLNLVVQQRLVKSAGLQFYSNVSVLQHFKFSLLLLLLRPEKELLHLWWKQLGHWVRNTFFTQPSHRGVKVTFFWCFNPWTGSGCDAGCLGSTTAHSKMFFIPFWTFVILHFVSGTLNFGRRCEPKEGTVLCFCNDLGWSLSRDVFIQNKLLSQVSSLCDVDEQLLYLQVALLLLLSNPLAIRQPSHGGLFIMSYSNEERELLSQRTPTAHFSSSSFCSWALPAPSSCNGSEKCFHTNPTTVQCWSRPRPPLFFGPGSGSLVRTVVRGRFHTCRFGLDQTEKSDGPEETGQEWKHLEHQDQCQSTPVSSEYHDTLLVVYYSTYLRPSQTSENNWKSNKI